MILQCPAFELPDSPLLSKASHCALQAHRTRLATLTKDATEAPTEAKAYQQWERNHFYQSEVYRDLIRRYPVDVDLSTINGVTVESFMPAQGITPDNRLRVLINLHGGAFCSGSQTNSRLESVPVAALSGIRVVSIDYRMAPEYRFPAATDDVLSVYQSLLSTYQPEQIGIFGASSGAQLVAMTLVRLQELELPLPAAVVMIAGGATRVEGDSVPMVASILKASVGFDLLDVKRPYFEGADIDDPKVTPARSDTLMAGFPPSMLISSTRDYLLSSVVATHRQLTALGADTELHVFEGLDHVFHYNPMLPESEQLHRLVVKYFERYLEGKGS